MNDGGDGLMVCCICRLRRVLLCTWWRGGGSGLMECCIYHKYIQSTFVYLGMAGDYSTKYLVNESI